MNTILDTLQENAPNQLDATATKPVRVAFVSFDFGEYCIQHANGLRDKCELMMLLPEGMYQPHASQLDPEVNIKTFAKPRLRQPVQQLKCVGWILRQLQEFQPDVVHLQRGHLWFNLALPFLKRYPLVVTIHDPRHHVGDRESEKTPQFIMDLAYRKADHVIVHGTHLKKIVQEEIGVPNERIHVVPHIAIGQRSVPAAEKTEEPLILFFGRIWLYKGLDYLIRAQPLINREFPDAKIMICGQGEDFQRYRKQFSDPDKFIVHNRWITDKERTEFFDRASVVVLPYIEATQSGVVPIAYAHSKPVVATRTGGLPDVVKDGQTGLLVNPECEKELANAVIKLLGNEQVRREMGRAGKQLLETELSVESVTSKTADVYQMAFAENNQPSRQQRLRKAK